MLIFNYYQTLEQMNKTGIVGIFQTASNAVPILSTLILFALWTVLTWVSFYSTQRRIGDGDFWASATVAGFITVIVATFFSFIPNFMIPLSPSILVPRDLVFSVILEIIFLIGLVLSREQ